MTGAAPKSIIVLGMLGSKPVAGVVWQTMQYLIGFRRLGYDVYYVEQHGKPPFDLMQHERDDGAIPAARFIERMMRRFDLGDHWCYQAIHSDGRYYGIGQRRLKALFDSAELVINMHGGTIPLPEHAATGRLIYLETDPVKLEIKIHENDPSTLTLLGSHVAFFTFGENYSKPGCLLPVSKRFRFHSTRQPILLDCWYPPRHEAGDVFTTIGNWRQDDRTITFQGETYHWSKHLEFLRFLDVPTQTQQIFELALSTYHESVPPRLQKHGWRVRDAADLSADLDAYRAYIAASKGEFTVAKDQNVRLRTGWFSDRSACYLASGRPVITQETGFSQLLPTGEGLFGFLTSEEILNAVELINADYSHHSRAAYEIAREFFSYDVVLSRLLSDCGVPLPVRDRPSEQPRSHRPDPDEGVGAVPAEAALASEQRGQEA